MISTSDFRRNSSKILWNNEPWLVLEFHHVKPGKGGAFVRTKMRNLITGRTFEETFRSGERFHDPDLENKKMQFLYADEMFHFMDQSDYEQISFNEEQILGVKDYLKPEEIYVILFFQGKPISAEPPMFMNLKIVETVPGVRGDTAQGGSKPAKMETGITVQVPLFLNEGDIIKVDTREDKYVERVSTEK